VVSKLASLEDIAEAEMAGAAAYLTKPLKSEDLKKTIKRIEKNGRNQAIRFVHI
jgi:DNA-binding NtrC family response regulator